LHRFPIGETACQAASVEDTYMMWAMVLIGSGAASAGGAGLFLPAGQRLAVALALVLGAGVGVASSFLLLLAGDIESPDSAARSFFFASVLGLAAVLAGLVVLFRRSRGPG